MIWHDSATCQEEIGKSIVLCCDKAGGRRETARSQQLRSTTRRKTARTRARKIKGRSALKSSQLFSPSHHDQAPYTPSHPALLSSFPQPPPLSTELLRAVSLGAGTPDPKITSTNLFCTSSVLCANPGRIRPVRGLLCLWAKQQRGGVVFKLCCVFCMRQGR